MKRQKIKKFLETNIYATIILFFFIWSVFWAYNSYIISPQISTQLWSYDSSISFTWSVWNEWYYVNDKDNSAIIWNYFKGYYYDSLFWFFKLDWSSNAGDNVRIIGSTTKCVNWYWYKLWGKAYSQVSWYIDFGYDNNTFVYYCLSDKKLHWTAYWKYIWYQSFDWIQIDVSVDVPSLVEKVKNDLFRNDTTNIENSTILSQDEIKSLWWNLIQIDDTKESIFYIIK